MEGPGMRRILIGGLAGGVILFAWGAFSHIVLPIGKMGLRSLANEETVLATMKAAIREPGLYFFPGAPGFDEGREMSEEEARAWEAKNMAGPAGLLLYHPHGESPMGPGQLGTQFAADVVAALLACLLLSWTVVSYGRRVLFVALMGLFAWVSISAPYWIWYRFPTDFIVGEAIGQVVGGLLAGLAVAAIVKPAS